MEDSRKRERSRSPRRAPRGSGGFRWKDKRPRADDDRRDNTRRDDSRPDYRNRSPPRHREHERARDGGRDRNQYRPRDGDLERTNDRPRRERNDNTEKDDKAPPRKEKKPAAPKPVGGGEEMIIVNVNDRLGTKAAIPCLPSDTIAQLKLMVAARIGREAGQILLKRQGERPFKDPICLADYGISNGVQLDLEVDTGD